MIRTIFIIQIICLALAFINVGITGANSYSELTAIGRLCCLIILGCMLAQFIILIFGIFKKR